MNYRDNTFKISNYKNMKLKTLLLILIFTQFLSNSLNAQENNSVILDKLNQLGDINLLPRYLEEDTHVGMVSTYDRKGKNNDGFEGTYSYVRKDEKTVL